MSLNYLLKGLLICKRFCFYLDPLKIYLRKTFTGIKITYYIFMSIRIMSMRILTFMYTNKNCEDDEDININRSK